MGHAKEFAESLIERSKEFMQLQLCYNISPCLVFLTDILRQEKIL
jgi:hypothetical protein